MHLKSMLALLVVAAIGLASAVSAENFNDNRYHEYVLSQWDETNLDVIIIPPAAPFHEARLAGIEQSIDAWESGIATFGASWLSEGLKINHYTFGVDDIPAAALADPDIIVVSAEVNPAVLFGIGLNWQDYLCNFVFVSGGVGPVKVDTAVPESYETEIPVEWHHHEGSGWSTARVDCRGMPQRCFVINTNFLLTGNGNYDMYDLNAHEFGHCLGAGHVGDALDFSASTFPVEDIMSYQSNRDQVHCVSNLNVAVLQGVFAKNFGRPTGEWLSPGDYYHMDVADYRQVACANPEKTLDQQVWDLLS